MAQQVEKLPAERETQEIEEIWVLSLGREDPLKEERAAHSRILPWRAPWTGELAGSSPQGHKKMTEQEHGLRNT